jgi:hypothetical protein
LYVFGLFVPTALIRGYPVAEVVPLLRNYKIIKVC